MRDESLNYERGKRSDEMVKQEFRKSKFKHIV